MVAPPKVPPASGIFEFGMRRLLGLMALLVAGSLLWPARAYASASHCRAVEAPHVKAVHEHRGTVASAALPAPWRSEAPCRSCAMPSCPSALCPVSTILQPAIEVERLPIAHAIPVAGEQRRTPSRNPQPPTPPPNHSQFPA